MPQLVLASQSPSRKELLEKLNIPFITEAQNIDETPLKKEKPRPYVKRLALEKAKSALKKFPDACIISADTIGYKKQCILQKPKCAEEARKSIFMLNNTRHQMFTGLCIMNAHRKFLRVFVTRVTLRHLDEKTLNQFILSESWRNIAPCYSITTHASFIKSINGSLSSVMGLPLAEVANTLKSFGVHHAF